MFSVEFAGEEYAGGGFPCEFGRKFDGEPDSDVGSAVFTPETGRLEAGAGEYVVEREEG